MSTRVGAKHKGYIKNLDTNEIMYFQFNPTTLQYNREIQYNDIAPPGISYPITQFSKGKVREFNLELFIYDNPSTGLAIKQMKFLGKLLTPETNVKGYKRPPEFLLCYGYFIRRCVLAGLNITNQMMDERGNPIQINYNMKIRQVGV